MLAINYTLCRHISKQEIKSKEIKVVNYKKNSNQNINQYFNINLVLPISVF